MLRQVLHTDAFQHAGDGLVHPCNGSLMVQLGVKSQDLAPFVQEGNEKRTVDGQDDFVG